MLGKRHSANEIVNKLRQAVVEFGRGRPVAEVCRLLGVTEPAEYPWRKEYGWLIPAPASLSLVARSGLAAAHRRR